VQTLKIALVADFHLGVNSNSRHVPFHGIEDKQNGARPVIIVDGDIFNSTYSALKDPAGLRGHSVRALRARYGVYAVYGNHDVDESLFGGFAITSLARSFRNPRVTVLYERPAGSPYSTMMTVTVAGGSIVLAGRRDGEKAGDGTRQQDVCRGPASQRTSTRPGPSSFAEHEPLDFSALGRAGADLALSGHTHDGQIFPGNFVTRILSRKFLRPQKNIRRHLPGHLRRRLLRPAHANRHTQRNS
jgi:predicted MPP superfamily phosphohydrolase